MAAFGMFVIENHIDSRTASSLASYWADTVASTMGHDVDFDELVAKVHKDWTGRLDERHRNALAAWIVQIHTEGDDA